MCFTGSGTKDSAPPALHSRAKPSGRPQPAGTAPEQPRQPMAGRSNGPGQTAAAGAQPQGRQARPAVQQQQNSAPQQAYGKDGYLVKGQISHHEGSTMKLMQNKKTKELVAAKWIPRVVGQGLTKNTEREIVNHRKLLHPNIIRFREVFMTDDCLVIVMEYASGGPLFERIKTSGRLAEADAKKFFGQLIAGIAYCHGQGIFHRDLRMENLLLQGSYYDSVLKISNFGYSKSSVLDSVAVTLKLGGGGGGQVLYSAPELMLGNPGREGYDGAAVDIWSCAICLYNMLFAQMPFLDPAEPNVMNARVNQRIIRAQYELPKDVPISREAQDLLSKIFVSDPKDRLTAPQIQQHPWLSGAELAAPEPPEVVAPAPQTEDDIKAVVARAHKRRQESAAKLEAQSSVDAPGLARMGDPPPKVAKTPNGTAGGSSRAPPADEKRTSGIEVY